MNVPPTAPTSRALGLEAIGALGIAVVLPALWAPLILVSIGLIIAAFVMAIVTIAKGRPISGALLIAACPFAAFVAFAMIGVQDEMRKQRRERDRSEVQSSRSGRLRNEDRGAQASPSPIPKWVRLTLDTNVYEGEKRISLEAGLRLKAVKMSGHDYVVEYQGGLYLIPKAITKAE